MDTPPALDFGTRVRTLVAAPAGWPGAASAPVGTLGTITRLPSRHSSSFGVRLDGHDDRLPAGYEPDEIEPADA
ncbi:hypothetical protein [Kitasatospora indigofera]|uniref:hypothetical protein n=1 Tax=Kitasatospora indigofera TaxID=67307 RepID=UPI003674D1A9